MKAYLHMTDNVVLSPESPEDVYELRKLVTTLGFNTRGENGIKYETLDEYTERTLARHDAKVKAANEKHEASHA